jgi:hypothetical protein
VREAFLAREPATLLVPVDPQLGVTTADLVTVEAWSVSLRGDGGDPFGATSRAVP